MKTFIATYTENNGTTVKTMTVTADDYTKAYAKVTYAIAKGAFIIELKEVSK